MRFVPHPRKRRKKQPIGFITVSYWPQLARSQASKRIWSFPRIRKMITVLIQHGENFRGTLISNNLFEQSWLHKAFLQMYFEIKIWHGNWTREEELNNNQMQLFSRIRRSWSRLSTATRFFPAGKLKRKSRLKKTAANFVGRHPINKPHRSKVWTWLVGWIIYFELESIFTTRLKGCVMEWNIMRVFTCI